MKNSLYVIIIAAFCCLSKADYALADNCQWFGPSTQMPRDNDKIVLQKVTPNIDFDVNVPSDALWDFSDYSLANIEDELIYRLENDSIMSLSNDLSYESYLRRNDTLFIMNEITFEKRIKYLLPECVLPFPISSAGDNRQYFYAEGTLDGNKLISHAGYSQSEMCGYGSLITPDNDSLPHAILTRYFRRATTHISPNISQAFSASHDSSVFSHERIEQLLNNDSITHSIEIFRWFAKGYRYPIIEKRKYISYYYGEPADSVTQSFIFLTWMQRDDLSQDEENRLLRDEDKNVPFFKAKRNSSQPYSIPDMLSERNRFCAISPNYVKDFVKVQILSGGYDKLVISVYNMLGSCIKRLQPKKGAGPSVYDIDMSGAAAGGYVVEVLADDDIYKSKIIKIP